MHVKLVDMICDGLLMFMLYVVPARYVCMCMQAIEEKSAAGDTASVQQEVDGIVQQLRLHVCHLSLHHVLSLPFAFTWSWTQLAWYIQTHQ